MRVGLDIGSTTIKCVVLGEHDELLYSTYERHYSHILEKAQELLRRIDAEQLHGRKALLSISGSAGMGMAKSFQREGVTDKVVFGVMGDSTFFHSGMTGAAEIVYNKGRMIPCVLDNRITGMTGHQQNPTTGYNIKGDPAGKINLEALCKAMGFNRVRVVDPYDLEACDKAVKEELAAAEPSVIISRRPCALLKYVEVKPPLNVDKDKCKGCKMCMKLGCPAISIKGGKAQIDNTLCVGCGVCKQLCKFDAIKKIVR